MVSVGSRFGSEEFLGVRMTKWSRKRGVLLGRMILALSVCAAVGGYAQSKSAAVQADAAKGDAAQTAETRITAEQAKELFRSVDDLTHYAAQDSGLPMRHEVKRTLTTRGAVEKYLLDKFDEDEDAKRMQRGEIVLKKFGLLDRDFDLKPFMLALLKEQIAGYYDSKTKTVYLLDWIDAETQKPVLVHELTHALQDQHTDLEKWSDMTPSDLAKNATEDNDHLARDEMDTARTAVLEGQAMAVFMDYELRKTGRSIVKNPELLEEMQNQESGTDDSPVLARAPLLLSESLMFPYKDGLSFEQDIWMDKGQKAAFEGVLDHPPASSWEVMNPRVYEQGKQSPVLVLPDIHPLLKGEFQPYDVGQVGQLDMRILAQILGGEAASRDLTPAWDGGIYWAGQRVSARTAAEQASTNSIALMYLSAWKNASSAATFAHLYGDEIGRKYSGVKLVKTAAVPVEGDEAVYSTNEGPVVITVRGKYVFVSESFDLETARKLAELLIDGQGTGEIRTAGVTVPRAGLSSNWVGFMQDCGMMKVALRGVRGVR